LAKIKEDYPKIRELSGSIETDGLMNYLTALLNLKTSTDDEFEDFQVQMVVAMDFIKSKFGQLTVEEIKEAFKMYVAREFSNIKVFRILDSVSIGEVLNAYIQFRNQSLAPYETKKQNLLNSSYSISESEKQQIRNEFLKTIFDEISAREFSADAFHLYEDLLKSGKINPTDNEKKKLYQQELQKYIPAQKKEIRHKGGYSSKTLLIDFQKRIDSGKPLVYIINRCQSIIVSQYLKNYLIDFETFKKSIQN